MLKFVWILTSCNHGLTCLTNPLISSSFGANSLSRNRSKSSPPLGHKFQGKLNIYLGLGTEVAVMINWLHCHEFDYYREKSSLHTLPHSINKALTAKALFNICLKNSKTWIKMSASSYAPMSLKMLGCRRSWRSSSSWRGRSLSKARGQFKTFTATFSSSLKHLTVYHFISVTRFGEIFVPLWQHFDNIWKF